MLGSGFRVFGENAAPTKLRISEQVHPRDPRRNCEEKKSWGFRV